MYIYIHLFLALRLLKDFRMYFCICKLNVLAMQSARDLFELKYGNHGVQTARF